MMEVAVGTSQGVSNGLKQSQEKARAAQFCFDKNLSPSGESKDYSGKQQVG